MHRLISSDMATVAGSRRAALGMTNLLHSIRDLAAQFRDRPIERYPNQSATTGIVPTVIDGKHPAFPSFSP